MLTKMRHWLIGPLERSTAGLKADLAGMDQPGRPARWLQPNLELRRWNKRKDTSVEPFFNQGPANTERESAA